MGSGCIDEDFKEIKRTYGADHQHELWNGTFCSVFRIKDQPKVLKIFKERRDKRDVVREKDVLLDIGKHQNIVRLLEHDLESSGCVPRYVMVFEYCDQGTLSEYVVGVINRTEPLAEKLIYSFILDIARGLEHLHGKNLLHRNLHPGNILVKTSGRHMTCVISGFRCCSYEDGNKVGLESDEEFSRCFDAPDKIYKKKSDMFSFGVIICALFRPDVGGDGSLVAYRNNQRFADVQDGEWTEALMYSYTRNKNTAQVLAKLLKGQGQGPTAKDVSSAVLHWKAADSYFWKIFMAAGAVGTVAVGLWNVFGRLQRR